PCAAIVAAPPALSAMALDVAGVRLVSSLLSVVQTSALPSVSPLKLAAPLPVVVAEALASVPPGPLATTAVTVTPLWLTGLPLARSEERRVGKERGTPLESLLEGWVVIASWPAAPTVPLVVTV